MIQSINKLPDFVDYAPRRILNGAMYLLNKKRIQELHSTVSRIDINSKDYSEAMAIYTDKFLHKKDLLCNFEDAVLDKIAMSDTPVIFIMNHGKQSHDPSMMMLFNAILNTKYFELGKCNTSPRPQIVMNKNIIDSQCNLMQEIFRKFGAVGIDILSGKSNNIRQIRELINGYLSGKSNIFIFPEGKNCVKKQLPLEKRFQDGISKIIQNIVSRGKTVKVVPLGFDYGKDKTILGSIFIGKPIYFKNYQERLLTGGGNIDINSRKINEISQISEITDRLVQNLKYCTVEAHKRLLNPDNISF